MKGKGARSRLKKRAISSYVFHPFHQTAIMAALVPPMKRKRARSRSRSRSRSRLNNRHLPSELIEEILLNLPHKSLLRFSAVSKSWNAIIFDPVFARKHKDRAALLRRHRLVVYMSDYWHKAAAVFSLAPSSSNIRIMAISNEHPPFFTLFPNAKVDVRDFAGQFEGKPRLLAYCDELWCVVVNKSLFLWNPSMRNIVELPPPLFDEKEGYRSSHFMYGLAYDSVNDDYKILKIRRNPPYKTELYSLKNNCWREIYKSFSKQQWGFQLSLHTRCEFVDGRFHWIWFATVGAPPSIISFDLSTEKYGEVAPPEYEGFEAELYRRPYLSVVALRGMLCASLNYTKEGRFVLWVMEEYGVEKSWTKKFDIPSSFYRQMSVFHLSPFYLTQTPFYLSDNNDMLFKCYEHDRDYMYIIMHTNGEAKPKEIVTCCEYNDVDTFIYVESLITHKNFSKSIVTVT